MPDFSRMFCPVKSTAVVEGTIRTAVFFVAPDYLAVGNDADYLLVPLSPATAATADRLDCPCNAENGGPDLQGGGGQFAPSPLPPSPAMTYRRVRPTQRMVRTQRQAQAATTSAGRADGRP